ncbi:MAG: hypothetical protein U0736_14425 [Gemmataceae bacterium]
MLIAQGRTTRARQAGGERADRRGDLQGRQAGRVPAVQGRGHGFARPDNRMKFYAVAEAFLAKHLGGRRTGGPRVPPAGAGSRTRRLQALFERAGSEAAVGSSRSSRSTQPAASARLLFRSSPSIVAAVR